MGVFRIDVGADHKCVIAFGKALGKLYAQAVGFLRRDLSGDKGLTHLIGNHIVRAAAAPGFVQILPLGKQKLCVGKLCVALIA